MNVVQSNKEQAASSRTSLKNVINNISQEITVTKDTQTTVAGNTPMHLELKDNQNGEMQVMAVAPINSVGEGDTRRIVIA